MTLSAHLRIAAARGAVFGLLLGHIDLAVRIACLNIDWYEVHLSLLLPIVVFAVLFSVVALLVHLVAVLRHRELSADDLADGYSAFVLVALPLPVVVLAVHLALFRDVLLWKPERLDLNTGIFFAYIVCVMLLLARGRELLTWCTCRLRRPVARSLFSNYVFFVLVFAGSSLIVDVYLLQHTPNYAARDTEGKPNVLLISLDTLRADHLGAYGYEKNTSPFLDSFAETSVVFNRAYSTTSWTLPAHASLFTGKDIYHHGASSVHQKLEAEQITMAEILRSNGYRTAGFIAGPYLKAKYGVGQGFDKYNERLDFFEYIHTSDLLSTKRFLDFFSRGLSNFLLPGDAERTAPEITRDALKWLEVNAAGPYFLFLNYFDTHDPYNQGLEYRHLFTDKHLDDDAINAMVRVTNLYPQHRYDFRTAPNTEVEYMNAMYDTEIYYLDKQLEHLFARLEELDALQNTIVIVLSDHGEEFYEHGGVMHKQTLYEEMLHVPLMIHFPQELKPTRIDAPVGLIDVLPTLLELLHIPSPENLDGLNVLPILQGDAQLKRRYLLGQLYAREEFGESYLGSLTGKRWKYIYAQPEQGRIPTALFDLEADPQEAVNLLREQGAIAQEINAVLKQKGLPAE